MTNLVLDLDLCEIRNVLLATPAVLRQQTAALPDRITDWHSGPGCWCVKQIVGHLIEEDKRDFVERIRLIIQHDEPRLGINDQDEIARMRRDCIKSLNVLLEEFDATRCKAASFVAGLKQPDLSRGGIHPKLGLIRVENLLHEWIYHDLNHLRQIAANIQHFLWDSLGNLKSFYP